MNDRANEPRPCERRCLPVEEGGCGEWKHHSRFRTFKHKQQHGSVLLSFSAKCKDCELIERNEKKNADRPKAIIEERAATLAYAVHVAKQFILINMNWRALIPILRAMMTPEGLCINCGHPFLNQKDIQIDHIEPPRSNTDWARHHARNIRLLCASCNQMKGDTPFAQHLDDQEEARISNERHRLLNQTTEVNPAFTKDDGSGMDFLPGF